HVVDRHDAAISGRDDVPRRIRRVLARLARDLRDRLPLETRILGIACIHEHDAVPAARGLHDVPPPRRAGLQLPLHACAHVRPRETRAQRIDTALVRHAGIVASRPVPPAVYGYRSAATSTPRARAESISAPARPISVPHPGWYAAFRWKISTGSPPFSPISIASATASTSSRPSPRMWLA